MASNLTILLIPGAWHRAAIFDGLKERLSHSYPSLAINLPTCGSEPPVLDGNEDAAAIRHVVEDLASNEKEIILVCHSYGALPASEAVKGMTRRDYEEKGRAGGVISMVLIASPLVPIGQSIVSYWLGGNLGNRPWLRIEEDGKYIFLKPEELLYNDLPEEARQYWGKQITHHTSAYRTFTLTHTAWNEINTTFIMCDQDRIAPIKSEEKLKELVKAPKIKRIDAGHAPFLSKPDEIASIILDSVSSSQSPSDVRG